MTERHDKTIAGQIRTNGRLGEVAKKLTGPRQRMLLHIDEDEPPPGCMTGPHRAVWHWLESEGLVAVTRSGTRIVSTHEGRKLADVIRYINDSMHEKGTDR